jgi:hypothetical protein
VSEPLRVALVGARRVRQGLGPWVARHLQAAGAQVVGHVGTSTASAAAATGQLAELAGVTSKGYVSADELLAEQQPQALVILAPAEHHERWLTFALERGLPTLCEKPLVWGGDAPEARARALVEAFIEQGIPLTENCQWPFTVPAWDSLFPEARELPPSSFSMRMSPARAGAAMLPDSLHHPISLLQELAPARHGLPHGIAFSTRDEHANDLEVAFTWPADAGQVACRVHFELGAEQPREAGWGLDDRFARRLIRMGDYAQFLAAGARVVDLGDPLGLLVERFVADRAGERCEDRQAGARRMVQRMDALAALWDAWHTDA